MPFDPNTFKDPDSLPHNATKFNPATFKSPEQAQAEKEQAKVQELASISPTKAALQGMMTAITNQAAGIGQVAFPNMPQVADLAEKVNTDSEQRYATAKEAHRNYAMGGYAVGAIAPGLLIPGGQATSAMGKIGEAAAMGAGIGNTQYVEDNDPGQRLVNTGIGGAVGGSVAAVPVAGKGVINWFTGGSSKVADDVAAQVAKAEPAVLSEAQEAARRTGIHLTPGETTANPTMLADEARLKVTDKGRDIVSGIVGKRQKQIQSLAAGIPKSLIPEGKEAAGEAVNKLYKAAGKEVIPKTRLAELEQYPRFMKIRKSIASDFGPDAPKPGTIAELQEVKVQLDGKINALIKSGDTGEAKALENLRSKLIAMADEVSPTYSKARIQAQRLIIQRTLEDKLAASMNESGKITSSAIRKAWFGTEENSKAFFSDLIRAGADAQTIQRAKDLQTVLSRLGQSKFASLATKKASGSAARAATKIQTATVNPSSMQDIFGQHDKAMIELISNPKWGEELSKIVGVKASAEQTAEKLFNLVGRASAKGATQNN
jgi:hypothetical protein